MNKLSKNLPTFQELVAEIGKLCDTDIKYEEAPHVIEVLLPTICSYLNYWWYYGPSAKQIVEVSIKAKQLEKTQSVDSEKIPTQAIASSPAGANKSSGGPGASGAGSDKFDG